MTFTHAGNPLWTFTPKTATTHTVAAGQTATIQYEVTNQSKVTKTLEMRAIPGVTQVTSPGNCPSPFVLASKQSCILNLSINGSDLIGNIVDGPEVCQNNSVNQCYRPAQNDVLQITLDKQPVATQFTVTATGDAHATVNAPTSQTVAYGASTTFTVTPAAWYDVTATGCGGSLSGNTYTTGIITADCSVTFSSSLISTSISMIGSPLLLTPNTTGSLTVTNTGSAPAFNVMAALPAGLAANVIQDASGCSNLAMGATCYLRFTSNNQSYSATSVTVSGTNTNGVGATITLAWPYITNGVVEAVAYDATANIIYLGGNFTQVGPNTGRGVPIDGVSGLPLNSFPLVNGQVNATIADGSGGWFIGGSFTGVGGVARNNIAHILSDGALDFSFNPHADNEVATLAVSGNTVYAGGNFSTIGGQTRNNIAALDISTGLATSWDPNANSTVVTLAVSGNTVYAGGSFSFIGGQVHTNIAAIDATTGIGNGGWNPNADQPVNALAVSGNTVYAGGYFSTIGGQTRNYIAALDANTGLATSWDPNFGDVVYALALSGSSVYAGGFFGGIGLWPSRSFAAIPMDLP